MSNLIIQQFDKKQLKTDLPEIKPGYTVKVHQKIKEGEKERVQIYEGLVISVGHGHGPNKTIMVRKIVEGIGVEKIFPLHSPNIVKIEVVRIGKVRRAKLFYMRHISGKAARLKEILVSGKTNAVEADAPVEKSEVIETKEVSDMTPEADTQEKVETAPESTNSDVNEEK